MKIKRHRLHMPTKRLRLRTPILTRHSSPNEDLEMGNDSKESALINEEIGVEDSNTQDLKRENNDLITFASIKDRKECKLDIHEKLEPQPECCIYRVPKELRKINEEAYTPQVISIGPLHYGKIELSVMEKQKIRFVREFCKRIREETWRKFINFLEREEERIRNCYAEMPPLHKLDFITMILYDAVFIIEYFLRWGNDAVGDFLIYKQVVSASILRDFQLLENQLPYFVLNGLYELAKNGGTYKFEDSSLYSLSANIFRFELPEEPSVQHFTDMRRHNMTKRKPAVKPEGAMLQDADRDIQGVVKLHESGVKFKPFEEKKCLLDIRFEKKKLKWIPCLKLVHHELKIPLIEIFDETESFIRNVMALEQCHYPLDTLVCNYVDLMDNLINTVEDVNLLVEKGVISNCVGDNAKIAKMFNQLCSCIICSDSRYYDVVMNLKAHYSDPWNHAKATLKRVYFSNPWKVTGTLAAFLLLLLTLIQTVCSIVSVM